MAKQTDGELIARALRDVLVSPNVPDANFEPAGLVDAIAMAGQAVAAALYRLGNADAATPMGGLEAHGKAILDASENIASAINNLAEAVREGQR